MPSMPSRAARVAAAAKSARIFARPAASSAIGACSPGECGTADGATAGHDPGSPSGTCAPPSHGARLDALRPAWASCMPILIGELARTAAEHARQRRLVGIGIEAEVAGGDAAFGRDRGRLDDQQAGAR